MLFEAQINWIKKRLPSYKTKMAKDQLRARIRQTLRVQDPAELEAWSSEVCARIEQLHAFRQARVVMMYYPVHHEVNLRPLMDKYKDEKTILLPVTHRKYIEMRQYVGMDDLKKGRYDIPTPQTSTYSGKPDLIIVPGIAFDKDLIRLGRGKGYYDKFLHKHRQIRRIGVCYDLQLEDALPYTWHDVRMDELVTPSKVIRAN